MIPVFPTRRHRDEVAAAPTSARALRGTGLVGAVCAVALLGAAAARAAIGPADFLKTSGEVIRSGGGQGEIVTLRGTNLGGWFVQEAWMSPNGAGTVRRAGWHAEPAGAQVLLDGDERTAWRFPTVPARCEVTLTFPAPVTFDRVALTVGIGTVATTGWSVSVSADGTTWKAVSIRQAELSHGTIVVALNESPTARAVRIARQAGTSADGSIAEINLEQSDDYTTRMDLLDRFGAEQADALIRGYQKAWITAADLDSIHEWGMNVVRVPLNWLDFMTGDGAPKDSGWSRLDWLVSECGQRGIYVILDLHAAPGGASPWASSGHAGDDGTGQNPNGFWTDPAFRKRAEAFWTRVAGHYRGNPVIAGYDVLNEPVCRFDERPKPGERISAAGLQKSAVLDALYRAVRRADPDHIVFMPAFTTSPAAPGEQPSGFDGITPPEFHGWTNIVYQTHHYDMEHAADHDAQDRLVTGALRDLQRHQAEWHVPLYAGEYSLYGFSDVWAKWMAGLNALHISWSNWTYKVRGRADEPGGGNWGFFHDNQSEVPDMVHDSAAEIGRKWALFDTGHFTRNPTLIDLVRRFTRPDPNTPAAPVRAPVAGSSWTRPRRAPSSPPALSRTGT